MITGSHSIFLKSIWNKSCSWATLLKFWFRTDLGRENSTSLYMQGRQSPLTFLTVTRWSCSTSNFYVLIGQNLTGEFMRKIYAALETCLLMLTDSWGWLSFVSSCDVLNCLFLLDVQNEIQLLLRCNISNMRCSVSSPDETPRRELKIRRAAEYFWRTSRCIFLLKQNHFWRRN